MKKALSLFVLIALFLSCNKDLVEKPENLIEIKVMEDIFYDMFILDAARYQNPTSLSDNGVDPKVYVYKKYKIDSLQFAKSNAYYAADYREYKKMFDGLNERVKKDKEAVDLINKKAEEKLKASEKKKEKKKQDSIKKAAKTKELKIKKEKDSLKKIEEKKELKLKTDSINKAKKHNVLKTKK